MGTQRFDFRDLMECERRTFEALMTRWIKYSLIGFACLILIGLLIGEEDTDTSVATLAGSLGIENEFNSVATISLMGKPRRSSKLQGNRVYYYVDIASESFTSARQRVAAMLKAIALLERDYEFDAIEVTLRDSRSPYVDYGQLLYSPDGMGCCNKPYKNGFWEGYVSEVRLSDDQAKIVHIWKQTFVDRDEMGISSGDNDVKDYVLRTSHYSSEEFDDAVQEYNQLGNAITVQLLDGAR